MWDCPHEPHEPHATVLEPETYAQLCLPREAGSPHEPVQSKEVCDHATVAAGIREVRAVGDVEHFSEDVEGAATASLAR